MYQQHFGFYTAPFSLAPSLRFLYSSQAFEETMAHLIYGLEGGEDFILITGETGAGKTLALNNLMTHLSGTYRVALVNVTQIDYHEVLKLLLGELGAETPEGADRADLLLALKRVVLEATAEGRRILLIIDEAQNLSQETLEGVRLLCNLGPADEQVIQVVLSGQPGLLTKLDSPDLVQLRQRIRVHYHLAPLDRREVAEYIRHRCRVAGCDREVFTGRAIDLIAEHSGGVPRLVNILADRALLAAYVDGAEMVQPSHVESPDDLPRTSPQQRRVAEIAAAAAENVQPPSPAGPEGGSAAASGPEVEGEPEPPAEAAAPARPAAGMAGDTATSEGFAAASTPPPMATRRPPSRRRSLLAGGAGILVIVILLLTRGSWLPLLQRPDAGVPAAVDTHVAAVVDTQVADRSSPAEADTATAATVAPAGTWQVPSPADSSGLPAPGTDLAALDDTVSTAPAAEAEALPPAPGPADTTTTSGAVPATIPPGLYIHAGSFRDLARAHRFSSRLEKLHLPVLLMRKELDGTTWYRVMVGPWEDTEAARRAEAVMRDGGVRDEMLVFRIR